MDALQETTGSLIVGRREFAAMAAVLAASLVLGPAQEAQASADPKLTSDQLARLEAEVLRRMNAYRKSKGLRKLKAPSKLTAAARVRAKEASKKFSHTRPGGKCFNTAFKEQGIKISRCYCGEILECLGSMSPENFESTYKHKAAAMLKMWLQSPPHKKVIVSKRYRYAAIGIKEKRTSSYGHMLYAAGAFCSKNK